ncbi:endo alpha-1,4 polygalactosaminidase [Chitinophaga vietnamensis]|uniref:endo alpha-1,4 polygalactosaminidase n=1 Tax=Chitinophaga vietnamensis TaxID=2593957 RepID=UPI001177DB2E|nr:endo alpha-1,4 polygalactosaminidase [Chitinophaga vietnamensis]
MRHYFSAMAAVILFTSCGKPEQISIKKVKEHLQTEGINYRQELRTFIQDISAWARTQQPNFIVVAQNSSELLTTGGSATDSVVSAYVKALNGIGREELLYGYDNNDDMATPADVKNEWLSLCKLAKTNGLQVMATDYCTTPAKITDSYQTNNKYGFISFAATKRQLSNVPAGAPYNENTNNINTLADAKNFLYYINAGDDTKFLASLKATNYDVLVIDAFSQDNRLPWSKAVINSLKVKKNGAKRLVLAYMSIGQAEQYRWYWHSDWKSNPPEWLEQLDPYWEGNFYVRYWMPEWKKLIYGNADAYTQKILDAGFDGTYLDPVDGSGYWEEK